MNALHAGQAADFAGGQLIHGSAETLIQGVSTDSRSIPERSLFVALTGDRFDGHAFLGAAADAGASAILVDHLPESFTAPESLAVIQTENTLSGLQSLAKSYRRSLPAKAVVITGSNGKTSTKDMIRGVLSARFSVTATLGNLNNHIGLPLSILKAGSQDDYGVWEIGMNHPGEIAPLAEIAAPDVAVITNIGTAHIGNMGSREAIAEEKGALAEAVHAEGVLVLNANDAFTSSISQRTEARVVTAGIELGDVQASALEMHSEGIRFDLHIGGESSQVDLPVPGRHMVSNAVLAAAVGHECGLDLKEISLALSQTRLTAGRLEVLHHRGVRVINDAYNANPDSMLASLSTVGAMEAKGQKFVFLGAMGELGSSGESAHREVGEAAVAQAFDHICSVAEPARAFTEQLPASDTASVHHFQDHEEAAEFLSSHTQAGDLVLLKGSRASAMDTIYKLFSAQPA